MFKDPLSHFAALGLGLFLAFAFLADDAEINEEIFISAAQQAQLEAAFTRSWRRPPSEVERSALIDDFVREEIASREAVALGLGEDDVVIRRRLRQKFESMLEQIAASVEPADGELESWYAARSSNYREDARFSLEQLFFSSDRRNDAAKDATDALLAMGELSRGGSPMLGDPLSMPGQYSQARTRELTDRFGAQFSEALVALPQGSWQGPVPSAYGYHLIRITEMTPGRTPALEEVRAVVLRDWRAEQIQAAIDSAYEGLRNRYAVTQQGAGESG
ncbi:MAG: peptidylprolyl isomerase [Pseudomonadota bacterium]